MLREKLDASVWKLSTLFVTLLKLFQNERFTQKNYCSFCLLIGPWVIQGTGVIKKAIIFWIDQYHWILGNRHSRCKNQSWRRSPQVLLSCPCQLGVTKGRECWRTGGRVTSEPQWLCFSPTLPVYRLLWALWYMPPANEHLNFLWPMHRFPQGTTIGSSQDTGTFPCTYTRGGGNARGNTYCTYVLNYISLKKD